MFVKICGITNEDDALLAVALGADAVGFVFAPSPRQIAPVVARDIARRLPPEVMTVGVFRDETPERVVEIVHTAGLRAAQLHGHETPETTRYVAARVPFVIQAFAAGDPWLERASSYGANAILVDSPAPGSGEVFDWALAEGAPLGMRVHARRRAHARERRDRDRSGAAVGRRRVDRRRGEPGPQGSAQAEGVHRGGPLVVAVALPRRRRAALRLAGRRMSGPVSSLMGEPDAEGRFGEFGGRFVPETLVPACQELEAAFRDAWADPSFRTELDDLLRDYAGRPSPLTECKNLGARLGVRLLLKREDLNHTGSHKINNVLGQALLARRMGKARLVAETGAGQHGVATATAAALLGMECHVYMGEVDVDRQALNVFRMRLLGAEVDPGDVGQPHAQGRGERGDARLGRVRRVDALLPRLGDGPAPVPVDGARVPPRHRRRGARAVRGAARAVLPTSWSRASAEARTPRASSPASSTPHAVLVGVEPAGGAAIGHGVPGVVHGMKSYLMQDEHGQVLEAESISAGLDYPGVGPEHSHLATIGRARYEAVTDAEVIEAFQVLSHTEGIIPALEPAHAIAWVLRAAPEMQGADGAREPVGSGRQGRRPDDGPARVTTRAAAARADAARGSRRGPQAARART